MRSDAGTEDVYEERIARFVELGEAAQRAAEVAARATRPNLQETYAVLAEHWLALARMARETVNLNRQLALQREYLAQDQRPARTH